VQNLQTAIAGVVPNHFKTCKLRFGMDNTQDAVC